MPNEVRIFFLSLIMLCLLACSIITELSLLKTEESVVQIKQQQSIQAAMIQCSLNHGTWMNGECNR